MNLGPQLLTQVAGGMIASYVDKKKPEWTKTLMPTSAHPVTITPGLMGAAAVLAAAAFRIPLPGKAILNQLAGGALIYEGVKLGDEQVTTRLVVGGVLPSTSGCAPHQLPAVAGYRGVYGPGVTPYELQSMLRQMPRAA